MTDKPWYVKKLEDYRQRGGGADMVSVSVDRMEERKDKVLVCMERGQVELLKVMLKRLLDTLENDCTTIRYRHIHETNPIYTLFRDSF